MTIFNEWTEANQKELAEARRLLRIARDERESMRERIEELVRDTETMDKAVESQGEWIKRLEAENAELRFVYAPTGPGPVPGGIMPTVRLRPWWKFW